MYRAFNLDIEHNDLDDHLSGISIRIDQRAVIKDSLDGFLSINGVIDGKELQNNWFPTIDAEIFISHSHADEELALSLAGWLKKSFGLNAFVDSAIWGYANELLKAIDDTYCRNERLPSYNYDKRNISTSHVHIMLCSALTKMMDRCECLMFLNTPQSISTEKLIQNQTLSPWLYYELTMAGMIQKPLNQHKNRQNELIIKSKMHSGVEQNLFESTRDLKIAYPVDLENMTLLRTDDLDLWLSNYTSDIRKENPLDKLYDSFGSHLL